MGKFEEYVEIRQQQIRKKQQLIVLISVATFLGSSVLSASGLISSAFQPPVASSAATNPEKPEDTLKAREQGYQQVLQREPKNQVALEGLAETRLQMNNAKGAIAPLEKLTQLYPERKDYKAKLTQAKTQVGDR